MVRRIRILVLLLVSGVSVAASGADNSASANDESHSSLPDLASEFDPEEQLYLSRLHDGRYVLHYTDRSYYVFGDFDSDGMAYLLFMEMGTADGTSQ